MAAQYLPALVNSQWWQIWSQAKSATLVLETSQYPIWAGMTGTLLDLVKLVFYPGLWMFRMRHGLLHLNDGLEVVEYFLKNWPAATRWKRETPCAYLQATYQTSPASLSSNPSRTTDYLRHTHWWSAPASSWWSQRSQLRGSWAGPWESERLRIRCGCWLVGC